MQSVAKQADGTVEAGSILMLSSHCFTLSGWLLTLSFDRRSCHRVSMAGVSIGWSSQLHKSAPMELEMSSKRGPRP